MKKLIPLLLLSVAAIFFSCESFDDNEGKANLPAISFKTAHENLPFQGEVTVYLSLDKPADKQLTIPFTLLGDAQENKDFEFVGLPDGITAEERHLIIIPEGRTEASLTLKHGLVNANPVQTQINLSRSQDDSYQLGNNKQILVKLQEREMVYVNFNEPYYLAREYSSMSIDFTLTGAQTGDEYKAPQDVNLRLQVVPTSTTTFQPQITNAPSSTWMFEDGEYVLIEEDSCKGSKTMRIRYADQKLPSDPGAKVPIFQPGSDWPAGYYYRFGVTFQSLPSGYALGDICDTTYVYVRRLTNPYDELLMGRKWINPTLWIDIDGHGTAGTNTLRMIYKRIEDAEYSALEEAEYLKIMTDTPEKDPLVAREEARAIALVGSKKNAEARWKKLPNEKNFNDGFYITKTEGTGVKADGTPFDEYHFHILHEVEPASGTTIRPNTEDSVNRPGFEKVYRDGLTIFNKYENMNMKYHPLGSGAPGIQFKVGGNMRFSWKDEALKPVDYSVEPEKDGISMYVIPSSSFGDTTEAFIDVFILGGNWNKGNAGSGSNTYTKETDPDRFTNFMHDVFWFANIDNQKPYRDNRYYDIWYRFYRDTRETNP